MSDTLGSIRAELTSELMGDLTDDDGQALINSKVNDAIQNIWLAMMKIQLARFFGLDSPVTFSLPSGAERVQLVSIQDPTVALIGGSVGGGNMPTRTYLVGYTFVTESGSETNLSPLTTISVSANTLCQVEAPAAPPNAFGWNLYASVTNSAATLGLQNQQPLPFPLQTPGNIISFYTEPPSGWQDYPVFQGQPPQVQGATQATPASAPPPNENSTGDNISWITHMEVRLSSGLLRSWRQKDIDSEVMRRYASSQAAASEYQTYAWDLINGNRLEVRPSAALGFTPRYFYVAKPRALRYDQARIPYQEITGVHQFIIDTAMTRLKLPLDEYLSSQAYAQSAAGIKGEILTSLAQESWGKNDRITPYLF